MVLDLSKYKCRISKEFVQQKIAELNATTYDIEEVIFGKNYFISESAFKGFSNLKTVQNIRFASSIGQSAFEDCIALEDIDLRYNAEIPKRAFARCISLQKAIFAPFVIIGQEAFDCCSKLKTLKNAECIAVRWKNSFRGCSSDIYDILEKNDAHVYSTEEDSIIEYLDLNCNQDRVDEIRSLCFGAISAYKTLYNVKKNTIVTVYRGPDKCYYYMLLEWIHQLRQMYPAENLDLHVVLSQSDYQELIAETVIRDMFSISYNNVFFHINSDAEYLGNNNIFNVFAIDWSEYNNVLYCDVDVRFNMPLDRLFSIESNQWLLCVPNDPPFKKENTFKYYQQFIPAKYIDKFQVFNTQPMFNGGMFMFNVKNLPAIKDHIESCREFILEVQHEQRNQHILNWVFLGHTQFIDSKYNNLYKSSQFNIDPDKAIINHYTTTGTEILYSQILNKLYDNIQNLKLAKAEQKEEKLAKAEQKEEKKNTILATNFDFNSDHLQFDFIVTFDGKDPKTEQRLVYNNETFTFRAEFSQQLDYSAANVKKFIEVYLSHTLFIDQVDEIIIDLDLESSDDDFKQDTINGQNVFLFNSGGCDSLAINELLRDQLKDDLINIFILYEDQKTKDKYFTVQHALNQIQQSGQKTFVFYIKKSISSKNLVVFEPSNLKSLRYLMTNTFPGAVYMSGDIQIASYGESMCTGLNYNFLPPVFMQTELLGLYILLKRNFDLYYPVIANSMAKQINKLVLLKYLLKAKSDIQCCYIDKLQKSVQCTVPQLNAKIAKQLSHSIEGGYIDILAKYKEILTELYPNNVDIIDTVYPKDQNFINIIKSEFNGDFFSANKKILDKCFSNLKCKKLENAFLESFKQFGIKVK